MMRGLWTILSDVFRDGAFRYGVKFGLAGMLAVFVALYFRLEEPTWALFTVFVLMIAQYVGAIGEKSFFRLIGTIIGGLLGFLLTGSLQQNPVIYLTLVGVVVGFCTAMFGQSRYPYAFLLCGMTTVVVTSNGMANPEQSWTFMLWRVEEVTVGILATLVVQSTLWPRFARVEFLTNMRGAFADLQSCLEDVGKELETGGEVPSAGRAGDFPARISALRALLDFGARESQHFRMRLATFYELTSCQARIASAISTMREPLPVESLYRPALQMKLVALHNAVSAALRDLGDAGSTPASRKGTRAAMDDAVSEFQKAVLKLRTQPEFPRIPDAEAMILGMHVLAFDEVRRQIERAQDLLDSLPQDPLQTSFEHAPYISPWPPPFWIRSGIKSGIAVVIALVLENWLNPPGATMFVLGTWVFTSMNANSPGGQGDRRTFHFLILSILSLLVLSFLLLAGRPLLSSYAVMNTVLFVWLFTWGYLSYSVRGVTIPMQFGMLCLVGILGLNGQQAISFQQIVDFFFGIALAQVLASIIQRVIWPSLPQWEVRDRLIELLDISTRVLENGPAKVPLWEKTRLALIPGETEIRIPYLCPPVFPNGEEERVKQLGERLETIGGHVLVTSGRLNATAASEGGGEVLSHFEKTLAGVLVDLSLALKNHPGKIPSEEPLNAALQSLTQWVADLRAKFRRENSPPLESLEILGLLERYRLAAEDAMEAISLTKSLNLRLLNSDCSL